MKKRAAIVILLAVAAFVYCRWKQATTVVVVDGIMEGAAHGIAQPGVYVDVVRIDTNPDGKKVSSYMKALVTKIEFEPDYPYRIRFTLEVPSAQASWYKEQEVVCMTILPKERSRFAEWMDWLHRVVGGE